MVNCGLTIASGKYRVRFPNINSILLTNKCVLKKKNFRNPVHKYFRLLIPSKNSLNIIDLPGGHKVTFSAA